MIVLLDTNILLDVLQKRPPHYDYSSQIWTLVEKRVLTGYVSAISFNNVFYVLRKQIGASQALEAVKLVRAAFRLVPLDEPGIDRAIAIAAADFEDAIQVAAGLGIGAKYVVTRNVKDFHALGLPPITPEEALALLKP